MATQGECQCCFDNKSLGNECQYGHFVCRECYHKLSREDCLLCNPMAPPRNPQRPYATREDITIPLLNPRVKILNWLRESLLNLYSFLQLLVCIVLSCLLLIYLGKCGIWCYFQTRHSSIPKEFGWQPQKITFTDFVVGLIVTIVLFSLYQCIEGCSIPRRTSSQTMEVVV